MESLAPFFEPGGTVEEEGGLDERGHSMCKMDEIRGKWLTGWRRLSPSQEELVVHP